MTILVTGGAGYIGSHTCVELLGPGHDLAVDQIVIADNFCNSKPDTLEKIRAITGRDFIFVETDIRDRGKMNALFATYAIDAVIHFAGLKAVGESTEIPLEYYDNNLTGTLVLLETMRDFHVKRIVFSSSATVYGMDNPMPLREEYPTSATNPYGYTKVVIERMLMDLALADPDWSICLLRYFNPIGAHPSGLIGEDPNGLPNNLAPYVVKVAAGELDFVPVYGNDYDTPDGTGIRDYIHILDLARGHIAALAYALKNPGIEAINLGTGRGTSVMEVIRAFEKACGHAIPFEVTSRRPGDIAVCYADTSKARRLLGFEVTHTLMDMCADAWRFAKERP